MVTRQTSLEAHSKNIDDGRYKTHKERILEALKEFPEGLTRLELRQVCSLDYPTICGRVNSMVKAGVCYEDEEYTKANASGRKASIVRCTL